VVPRACVRSIAIAGQAWKEGRPRLRRGSPIRWRCSDDVSVPGSVATLRGTRWSLGVTTETLMQTPHRRTRSVAIRNSFSSPAWLSVSRLFGCRVEPVSSPKIAPTADTMGRSLRTAFRSQIPNEPWRQFHQPDESRNSGSISTKTACDPIHFSDPIHLGNRGETRPRRAVAIRATRDAFYWPICGFSNGSMVAVDMVPDTADHAVRPVMRIAQNVFRVHLAVLDIRQNSSKHERRDRATVAGRRIPCTRIFHVGRRETVAFLEQEARQVPARWSTRIFCWRGSPTRSSAHYGSSRTLDGPRIDGLGALIVQHARACLRNLLAVYLLAREVVYCNERRGGRFFARCPVCTPFVFENDRRPGQIAPVYEALSQQLRINAASMAAIARGRRNSRGRHEPPPNRKW